MRATSVSAAAGDRRLDAEAGASKRDAGGDSENARRPRGSCQRGAGTRRP